jgi:hypothetical protein
MDCKMAQLQLWKESPGEYHSIPHEKGDYPNQGCLKYILTLSGFISLPAGAYVSKWPPCTSITRVTMQRPWFDHSIPCAIWRLPVLTKLSLSGHMICSIPAFFLTRNSMWSAFAGIYFHSVYREATEIMQVCTYNTKCGRKMVSM